MYDEPDYGYDKALDDLGKIADVAKQFKLIINMFDVDEEATNMIKACAFDTIYQILFRTNIKIDTGNSKFENVDYVENAFPL